MQIPQILIKLSGTRIWRHKWKVLAFSPFVLAIVIYVTYSIYNHLAERDFEKVVQSWESRGESTDIHAIYPPAPPDNDNFFRHSAYLAEKNKSYTLELGKPNSTKIPGFSPDSYSYTNNGTGDYRMGVSTDIRPWLASAKPPTKTRSRRGRHRRGKPTHPLSPPATPVAVVAVAPVGSEKEAAIEALGYLGVYSKRLDALAEASRCPSAHLPNKLEEGDLFNPTDFEYVSAIRNIQATFTLRAKLRIRAGQIAGATDDINTLLRIQHHSQEAPYLIGFLISLSGYSSIEAPLWDGLKQHVWDDATLAHFESQLAPIDERKHILQNMRQEMAYNITITRELIKDPQLFEREEEKWSSSLGSSSSSDWKESLKSVLRRSIPNGLTINNSTWSLRNEENLLFYPSGKKCDAVTAKQAKQLYIQKTTLLNKANFYIIEATETLSLNMEISLSWLARQIEKALRAQASIHNMRTAIALERYHLKHQNYPERLADLVPAFLPRELEDVITGKPLHYRIKSDGTPLIYSVGLNEKDDDGKPYRSPKLGDWAWMYSPPKGFTNQDYRRRDQ